MNWDAIRSKKIAGIPVLYLALGAVIVFAVWAWQMKSSTGEEATGDEGTTGENVPESDADSPAADYSGLATTGTVVVQQPGPVEEESVKQTNDDWLRAAVSYLIAEKKVTPGDAQIAITNYLEGNDMTYEQGALKDAAISKLGLPPERISTLGNVATKADPPAQRQFNAFPGKHTVKGSNDNTAAKIAQLYYGNSGSPYVLKIVAANSQFGTGASYNVGTVLHIPKWVEPRYYTVTSKTRYPGDVAKKNGIPYDVVIALNPGKTAPYAVGTKIRIS